jgi:hypothetical protein
VKKILALASFAVLALASSFAQTNTIQLRNGANTTTIIAPTGGNYTLTLPAGAGTNGQVLSTNGSGTLSWSSTATSIDGLSDAISNSNVVALGSQAGASLTTGGFSVFVGNQAGRDFTGSTNAVAVGYGAMRLATGGDNVSIGTESLNGLTTGTNNVAIGTYAGTTNVTTGSGNVFIGDRVYPSTNVSNKLYIDNAYSASDKPLIYGDFSTDQLTLNGHVEVAIGTTTSTVPFSIVGTGIQGAANVENAYLGTDVPTLFVRNTTNSADANAVLLVGVGGSGGASSAGDAYLSLDVATVGGWSMGIDNSDSDKLKFLDSWDFKSDGGTPAYGLPVMTMTRLTRRVGIGTENPTQQLEVSGTTKTSNMARNIRKDVTGGTHTVTDTDSWIIVDRGAGLTTITLPSAADWPGRELMFKTVQAQTVVSNASNVVPIDDLANPGTAILPATDGAWATLVSDGTNWIIMQRGQ